MDAKQIYEVKGEIERLKSPTKGVWLLHLKPSGHIFWHSRVSKNGKPVDFNNYPLKVGNQVLVQIHDETGKAIIFKR